MCCSCSSAAAEFYGVFPAHAAGSAVHSGQCAAQRSCAGVRRCHGLPFSDGTRQPLCTFAGQDADLFARLPVAEGVGIALQMTDGTTRVLRMSEALERHLRQEWTPYLLANAADIKGEEALRVLLYQDSKAVPMISLLEKSLGDRTAVLLGERAAADTLILTPEPSLAVKCWMPCVCRWHRPGRCAGTCRRAAYAGHGARFQPEHRSCGCPG